MRVILVVTDTRGENLVFSTNSLRAYSLDESLKIAREGKLESIHVVKTAQGSYLRANPWEEALDKLGAVFVGRNASVGIAQVTMDTAIDVIRAGYYNPNPDDKKISPERIAKVPRAYLYAYVVQSRHNVYFAAARIRQTIDYWAHEINLSKRPEILGTLYNQGLGEPKPNPGVSDRGRQIAQEFYPFAKIILQPS